MKATILSILLVLVMSGPGCDYLHKDPPPGYKIIFESSRKIYGIKCPDGWIIKDGPWGKIKFKQSAIAYSWAFYTYLINSEKEAREEKNFEKSCNWKEF